jgi:ubiquinone/menaquinone biosynthesis C-methylase UbiE
MWLMPDLHAGFQNSSTATLPDLLTFLDQVDQLTDTRAIKRQMRELLALRPGERVVEVGSGMGHELARLAAEVAPAGTAIGVDLSAEMAGRARQRVADLDVSATAVVGDAQHLAFPDGWADAVRTERVLKYVPDTEQAIAELVRITRPGGRVAAFELDYGATLVDVPDEAVASKVLAVLAGTIPHRWMGRSLGRLLHAAGLQDIVTRPFPLRLPYPLQQMIVRPALEAAMRDGSLDDATFTAWLEAGRDAEQAGHHADTFFGMVAYGTKPRRPGNNRSGLSARTVDS